MFTVTSASEDLSPSRGNWLVSSSLRTFSQRLLTSTILFHIRASSPYITWLANTTGWGASETRWTAAVFSKVFTNSSLKSSLAFWVGAPTNFSWRALALSARTQNSNPCSSSVWITKYYHSLSSSLLVAINLYISSANLSFMDICLALRMLALL